MTRRSPNDRTSGLGERAKTAKPAIVARQAAPITGPPPPAAVATARPGGSPLSPGLVEAGLELDRVVHREADQHRQHCDRADRERATEEGDEPEGERACGDRHPEGQQPQRARQDEKQRQGHHQAGDPEQQQRLVAELPRAGVDHDRGAGDDVAAVGELEARVLDSLLEEADRLVPLGVGQVGAEADDDLGRVPVREEVAEALLRGTGRLGLVEDDAAHEVRVVEPRDRGDARTGSRPARGCPGTGSSPAGRRRWRPAPAPRPRRRASPRPSEPGRRRPAPAGPLRRSGPGAPAGCRRRSDRGRSRARRRSGSGGASRSGHRPEGAAASSCGEVPAPAGCRRRSTPRARRAARGPWSARASAGPP